MMMMMKTMIGRLRFGDYARARSFSFWIVALGVYEVTNFYFDRSVFFLSGVLYQDADIPIPILIPFHISFPPSLLAPSLLLQRLALA